MGQKELNNLVRLGLLEAEQFREWEYDSLVASGLATLGEGTWGSERRRVRGRD